MAWSDKELELLARGGDAEASRRLLNDAIHQLSLNDQVLIDSIYSENLEVKEIADRLGVSANTIVPRIFQARERLREVLSELRSIEPRLSLESERNLIKFRGTPEIVILARRFFTAAGRKVIRKTAAIIEVPEMVAIHADAVPEPSAIREFGLKLHESTIGYLVHTGLLAPDSEDALNTLRFRGTLITPISEHQLRSALQDGNARTILHALTLQGRGGDNLFHTRNALIDRRFLFGRSETLAQIGSALGRGEQILITGSRKVGKTSFLNILRQDREQWPVVFCDLQRYDRRDARWVGHLFGEIVAAYDRWGKERFGDWPGEAEEIADGMALERALVRRREWHAKFEPPPQQVVILDELERLLPRSGEQEVAESFIRAMGALRALAQGQERFVSIIAADLRTSANRRNDLEGVGTNPLFRFFHEVPLPPLSEQATGKMIDAIGRTMGIRSVDEAFHGELFDLSGGHPYIARTIAGAAAGCRSDSDTLGERDLHRGLEQLDDDDELGDFFEQNFWQPLSDPEREYILCLVRGGSPKARSISASLKHQGLIHDGEVHIRAFRDWLVEMHGADAERLAVG